MNLKLTVEYEGTRYHGWQAQAGALTIEAKLSEAIHDLTVSHRRSERRGGPTPAFMRSARS